MLPDISALPDGQFWFWAIILSLLTLAGFYFAFRNLARARIIEDTPTSRIRSAHQGYVELSGEAAAMQGEPILSPLTFTPCCWFRYRIERRHDKGWRPVRSGASESLFLIRDATGEAIIDPEGAEITPKEKSVWYGNSATPAAAPKSANSRNLGMHPILGLTANIKGDFGSSYRYTEETIYPGDPLYAIGLFSTFGEADHLAMRDDLIKARLAQWKADNSILLERFDRDRDGKIDMTEWEVARRTAKREITKEQLQEGSKPFHTLSQSNFRRRPFLISSNAEFKLVKRFRYLAIGSTTACFLCGTAAIWMFTMRFSG